MSVIPIKKPLNGQLPVAKPRLKVRTGTTSVSPEDQAKANFPNNLRAQELDIKVRTGRATDNEKTEFRQIIADDSDRLMDLLCARLIEERELIL